MGQVYQTRQARVPVIRKIFRKGDIFTCGICRSNHNSRVEANHCLNECWFQLRHHYPLIHDKQLGGPLRFKCQFCFRIYDSQNEGLACAQLCMEAHETKHLHEQLTNDLPISTKPRQKFRLIRVNSAGVKNEDKPTVEPQVVITAQKAPPQAPSADPAAPAVADAAEAVPSAAKKPDNRRHISYYEKSWIRDGAKYKCCYCGTLHYTRMEVEPCFNGHFDEAGLEQEVGGHISL